MAPSSLLLLLWLDRLLLLLPQPLLLLLLRPVLHLQPTPQLRPLPRLGPLPKLRPLLLLWVLEHLTVLPRLPRLCLGLHNLRHRIHERIQGAVQVGRSSRCPAGCGPGGQPALHTGRAGGAQGPGVSPAAAASGATRDQRRLLPCGELPT